MSDDEELSISEEMIETAAAVIGLQFTPDERRQMQKGLSERLEAYEKLRDISLDNSVPPALAFDPRLPEMTFEYTERPSGTTTRPEVKRPSNLEDIAFYPLTHLAELIRTRQVTSLELTQMYLSRLKRYDPYLKCVVTLTEELALAQAKQADEEMANGRSRGPLHGIPWGAKDLLATRNYKTTWGAAPFKDQLIDADATVVQRLTAAGAVLIAKLTSGALAYGDIWFDGTTKNPWNLEEGSSGSSAGPAAATAAGLVGFSIGSETLGSIVSPSTRCGTTGLRPTFGRVSRHGAMALSWSMDKLGPICRTVEDCALVFDAIYGPDEKDTAVVDLPFHWNPALKLTDLRIGYVPAEFERERDHKAHDDETLAVLRSLGVELIPLTLPDFPYQAMLIILMAEAAAAFDELTRTDQDDLLVWQEDQAWPNSFRQARFIPAIEYIHANRIRTQVMQAMATLMQNIDVYVCPSYQTNLFLTNLTGHPAVVLPNGFDENGTPAKHSITFTGKLYGEAALLAVARAYQEATDFHYRHPPLDFDATTNENS